jgi:hypothetical protein
VNVSRPSDALTARGAAVGAFDSLFLRLGVMALIVGAVGVANIMIIAVLERRSEIGLRRALGATKGQIRTQFLSESILLAVIGGVVGVLAGAAATAVSSKRSSSTSPDARCSNAFGQGEIRAPGCSCAACRACPMTSLVPSSALRTKPSASSLPSSAAATRGSQSSRSMRIVAAAGQGRRPRRQPAGTPRAAGPRRRSARDRRGMRRGAPHARSARQHAVGVRRRALAAVDAQSPPSRSLDLERAKRAAES